MVGVAGLAGTVDMEAEVEVEGQVVSRFPTGQGVQFAPHANISQSWGRLHLEHSKFPSKCDCSVAHHSRQIGHIRMCNM